MNANIMKMQIFHLISMTSKVIEGQKFHPILVLTNPSPIGWSVDFLSPNYVDLSLSISFSLSLSCLSFSPSIFFYPSLSLFLSLSFSHSLTLFSLSFSLAYLMDVFIIVYNIKYDLKGHMRPLLSCVSFKNFRSLIKLQP